MPDRHNRISIGRKPYEKIKYKYFRAESPIGNKYLSYLANPKHISHHNLSHIQKRIVSIHL